MKCCKISLSQANSLTPTLKKNSQINIFLWIKTHLIEINFLAISSLILCVMSRFLGVLLCLIDCNRFWLKILSAFSWIDAEVMSCYFVSLQREITCKTMQVSVFFCLVLFLKHSFAFVFFCFVVMHFFSMEIYLVSYTKNFILFFLKYDGDRIKVKKNKKKLPSKNLRRHRDTINKLTVRLHPPFLTGRFSK